jgi:hypothetical protein
MSLVINYTIYGDVFVILISSDILVTTHHTIKDYKINNFKKFGQVILISLVQYTRDNSLKEIYSALNI